MSRLAGSFLCPYDSAQYILIAAEIFLTDILEADEIHIEPELLGGDHDVGEHDAEVEIIEKSGSVI